MRLCGIGLVTAALLMSTSSRPQRSTAAATSRLQSSSFDTSACTAIDSTPLARHSAAMASPPALSVA